MLGLKIQFHKLMILTMFFEITNYVWGGDYYPEFYSPYATEKGDFFWNEALNVMSFHRSKMNEYLCKNYLANEIVEALRNRSGNVEKRVGEVEKKSNLERDSLLADPGSKKYQDWLSRSSTLEDIYRQFEHSEKNPGTHHDYEPEHEGEVTGYAVMGHKPSYSKPIEYAEVDSHYIEPHLDPHSHDYHNYYDESDYEEKGLKLKELFHFALTAIAFLAFATFMIEVIMYLMDIPQQQPVEPDYVLIPTATGTGSASKIEETEPGIIREERALGLSSLPLDTVNTMASRVLTSIEALTILYEDDGQCLRKALCENTKFSKTVPGIQKIWLPIWSLGASWIAGRLSKGKRTAEGTDTLEYLKATVMGLGSQECHFIYPSCKRMRRKKRKAS